MITVRNVNKSFDDYQALKNLSVNVQTGSIYGLVGTNGSGKTTIIKHLTGVLKQDSGEILFDGEPVYENAELKAKIGFIPDDLSFFSQFTLKDAVRYYKAFYPLWDQARYDEMIRTFGLVSRKKMNSFSKGMQKQAAFILAMSTHPEYLILDEPIDGLDPIIRKLVWKYVVEDVADGMTVLVSSHNLKEIEGICDNIGILDKGKIIVEKELDELRADINKIQVAFADGLSGDAAQERYEGLNVVHKETRGKIDIVIIRNDSELIRNRLSEYNPLFFEILPLSLEEIFICEMGGEYDEIKDLVL